MKKAHLISILLGLGLAFASTPDAFAKKKGLKARKAKQHKRIKQGVKSGELTKEEAKELRQEQKAIREKTKELKKNDGKLDKAERKQIHDMRNEASKNIKEQKHDTEKGNKVHTMNKRVKQGVKSGELTKGEVMSLQEQKAAIKAKRKEFKENDGKLDRAERKELKKMKKRFRKISKSKKTTLKSANKKVPGTFPQQQIQRKILNLGYYRWKCLAP